MAYTQSQAHTAATRVTSGSTITKAYTSNNTAGNLLVAAISVRQGSGTPSVVFVSDTAGNPWRMIAEERSGLRAVVLWACDRAVGGANTVTATAAAAVASMQMDLLEYAGGSGYELIDSIGAVTGTATPEAATTIDTCAANDLVISVAGSNSTTTSFTKPSTYTADAADATSGDRFAVAHLLDSGVSAAQTASWTTQSGTAVNVVVIAAFKQTGVAASAPHIRQTAGSGGSGASSALTLQTNTAAGNAIVACVLWFVASGTPNITSVTDTQGLSWQKAGGNHDATNLAGVDIWYANNATAAAETVTANYSPNATGVSLVLIEIAGTNLTLTARSGTLGTAAHTATATSHAVSEAAASVLHDVVIALHGDIAAANVARSAGWDQAITRPFNSVAMKLDSTAAINTSTWTTDVAVKSDSVIVGFWATSPLTPVTTTLTPSVQKAVTKTLSTSVASTPTITKTVGKNITTSTVATAAALTTIRSYARSLIVTVTATPTIRRIVAKALSVTTIATPVSTKAITHPLSATVSSTPLVTKNVGKPFPPVTVSLTVALTMFRAFVRTLSASIILTPTLSKKVGKNLTATAITLTATLQRAVVKNLAIGVIPTAVMARGVAKTILSSSVTLVSSLITGKGFFRTLISTVTLSSSLNKQTGKALSISSVLAPTLKKQVGKQITGTTALSTTIAKAVAKPLTASTALSSSLLAGRGFFRTLSITTTVSPSITKMVGKPLGTTVALSPTLAKKIAKVLASSVVLTPTITKAITKTASASVTVGASLLAGRGFFRTLTATTALAPSLTRAVGKGLTASVGMTSTIRRSISKVLNLSAPVISTLNKATAKSLLSSVSLAPSVVAGRELFRTLSASVSLSASLLASRSFQQLLMVSTSVSASVGKSINKRLQIALSALGSIATVIKRGPSSLSASIKWVWMMSQRGIGMTTGQAGIEDRSGSPNDLGQASNMGRQNSPDLIGNATNQGRGGHPT